MHSGLFFSLCAIAASAGSNSSSAKNIVFLGDSFTDGYELGKKRAYPSIIKDRIGAFSWNMRIVKRGVVAATRQGMPARGSANY